MSGGFTMDRTMSAVETQDLLKELDQGIDDMENGRITLHEDSMKILVQRYEDYVLQDSGNRRSN